LTDLLRFVEILEAFNDEMGIGTTDVLTVGLGVGGHFQ
jgi:hypothetical protein